MGNARLVAGPQDAGFLESVFVPGARLGVRADDPATFVEVVEVEEVTTIRVPSGRLIVDSPWSEDRGREIVARVPPGTYRVEAAWTEAPYEHGGEYFDGRECAATRLCVSDDPVVVWEAGVGVNDDIGDADVAAAGFHSDSEAMGAIADAEAWEALTAPFHRFRQAAASWGTTPAPDRDTEDLSGGWFEKSSNEGCKADLIAFDVAEGWAPVWIGRTRTGAVASILVPGQMATSTLA
ncbi:DUF4241 domain-containing protein [Streptomyces sp. NBC_01207]|uniref:DUF4241 domain-containing protein n=1 Tax=Streptomyces sp. NBC_01207 TaxID=2903772 RepID=UPI002E1311DE|nr:DUF4241 domain-containing protein [Streptomyces sp. NBC_01207]